MRACAFHCECVTVLVLERLAPLKIYQEKADLMDCLLSSSASLAPPPSLSQGSYKHRIDFCYPRPEILNIDCTI